LTPTRPRRSREQLRAALLQTGVAVLSEEGLAALTFKRVFERYEKETGDRLTNASIIRRVWENQADFRADVLVAIALEENENEVERTLESVYPILLDLDVGTLEARERTMRELCRLGAAANVEFMRRSGNWPLWTRIWGLAASGEPFGYRQRIEQALVTGYDAFNDRIEEVYMAMARLVGYRIREPLTLRQFTVAADTMGQGCGLRDRLDSRGMDGIMLPTGPGGEDQEWTLFGIAFEGLVKHFFEPDPEWEPDTPATLSPTKRRRPSGVAEPDESSG
jgi:hypothetical protein